MKKDIIEQLCKQLSEISVFDHATFFEELKKFTHDRMLREMETRMSEAKQLEDFVKNVITLK